MRGAVTRFAARDDGPAARLVATVGPFDATVTVTNSSMEFVI